MNDQNGISQNRTSGVGRQASGVGR